MSVLERFHVDFFLMGDVAAYRQSEAEKRQTEPSALEGAHQTTPLPVIDWAIFISDFVPYAELKAWLVEHEWSVWSEQDNPYYLRFTLNPDAIPVTVALIPFGEIARQERHWVPTGFGMARRQITDNFECTLDSSRPIKLWKTGSHWIPMTLPEVMVCKLRGFVPGEPFKQSTQDARDVSSIIVNYQHLEQPHVFLFHSAVYLEAHKDADDSKLALLRCNAQVLGRQMRFTVRDDESARIIRATLYSEDFLPHLQTPELLEHSETMQATIALAMSRPTYYGDPTVLNHATCHDVIYSMGYGLHGG